MPKTKKPNFQAIKDALSVMEADLAGAADVLSHYSEKNDAIGLVVNNLDRIGDELVVIADSLPEEQSGEESHG